jgi:hypothetical protein
MTNMKTQSAEEGQRLIPYVRTGRLKRGLPRRMALELGLEIDPATPLTLSIPQCGKLLGIGKQLAYAVAYAVNE